MSPTDLLLHTLLCPTGTKTSAIYPHAEVFSFTDGNIFLWVVLKKNGPISASLNGPVKNNKQGGCVVALDVMLHRSNANAAF